MADLAPFRAYEETNPTWGSLHIVLDDGNIDDDCVRFCLEYARQKGDAEGEELAKILLDMTEDQREDLLDELTGP